MTETELRKPLVKKLREAGALVTPYVGSLRNLNGTADAHIIHPVFSGWVEFKGPKTLRKPLQEKFIWDCRIRRYPAVILRFYPRGNEGQLEWPVEKVSLHECDFTEGGKTLYVWVNFPLRWSSGRDLLEQLREWKETYSVTI